MEHSRDTSFEERSGREEGRGPVFWNLLRAQQPLYIRAALLRNWIQIVSILRNCLPSEGGNGS